MAPLLQLVVHLYPNSIAYTHAPHRWHQKWQRWQLCVVSTGLWLWLMCPKTPLAFEKECNVIAVLILWQPLPISQRKGASGLCRSFCLWDRSQGWQELNAERKLSKANRLVSWSWISWWPRAMLRPGRLSGGLYICTHPWMGIKHRSMQKVNHTDSFQCLKLSASGYSFALIGLFW